MRQHLRNRTSVYNLGTRSARKQHLSVIVIYINPYSVLVENGMRQHLRNMTSVYNLGTKSARKQHLSVRREFNLVLYINPYSDLAGNEMR